MATSSDFIVVTDVPREKLAKALGEVARNDLSAAITEFQKALTDAYYAGQRLQNNSVGDMRAEGERLGRVVAAASDGFVAALDEACRLAEQAGDLADDDPPTEETAR